ncbi:MAG: T9SS type A sorting domain-containing protein [Ignavibacteriales bacterium]|nr:T9SS type A sorting domain-containing protein [Ignavibacteriales bacterium]
MTRYLLVIFFIVSSAISAQVTIDFNGNSEGAISSTAYTSQGISNFSNGYYYNNHLSVNTAGTPMIITFEYTQPYVKLTLVVSNNANNEAMSAWTGSNGDGTQIGSTQTFTSTTGEYSITGSGIKSAKITHSGSTYNEYNLLKYDSTTPVELVFFAASTEDGYVKLEWETATEINNFGFSVQRKTDNEVWEEIGFVHGHGNSNSPKYYLFVDQSPPGGEVFYRIKQIDFDGAFKYYGPVDVAVNIARFTLNQNFPNPFNPVTTISYWLPEKTNVKLVVFDILGREVAELVNGEQASGVYNIKFDGSNLNSGIYFYRLDAGEFTDVKKLLLVK